MGGGDDGDAESAEDAREVASFGVMAQAGARDAFEVGDDGLFVWAEFEEDGEDTLFVVVGDDEVEDEAFVFEDLSDGDFDIGSGDFDFIMEDGIGIADAGEHIGNGIGKSQEKDLLLPTGFGDAGDIAGVGMDTEADAAHLEFTDVAVRSAADFATVISASGEFGFALSFEDERFFSHERTSLRDGEGHAEEGEKLASLKIGAGGGGDDDVEPADFVDFIVVDFREDELFLDAEGEVAAAVEGRGFDAAEVANAREGDVHKFIEEMEHASTAEGDLAADGHTLAEFPSGEGFASASDDGFLAGDGGEVGEGGFESFGIADGVAASHVEYDFVEFGNLHDIFIIKMLHHGRDDFGFIFIGKSVQDNTTLVDEFAAFFAEARVFTVDGFMSDASGLMAVGTKELDFAGEYGKLLGDDAALRDVDGGFGMAFNLIDTLDDDFAGFGEGGEDFTLFTLIPAGEDDDGVALFNVKFNERHG